MSSPVSARSSYPAAIDPNGLPGNHLGIELRFDETALVSVELAGGGFQNVAYDGKADRRVAQDTGGTASPETHTR
jgi:hypothetical protein